MSTSGSAHCGSSTRPSGAVSETLLVPPRAWADDLEAVDIGVLRLSVFPQSEPPPGRTYDEVAVDLARGAWIWRDRRAHQEIYRLGGAEFELRVQRRRSEESGTSSL